MNDLAPPDEMNTDEPENEEMADPLTGLVLDGFALLPEKALVDDKALGIALGRGDRSIRRMVERGELPPGISIGGRTLWIVGRVIRHLHAMAEREETKAEMHLAKLKRLEP
jgi:hypothetical protein